MKNKKLVGILSTSIASAVIALSIIVSGLIVVSGGASAHGNATGIVKERMDMMDQLGKSMKRLKTLVRQKTDFNADEVAEIAAYMENTSKHIPSGFPEGSIEGPSEALPAIWENWNKFTDYTVQLAESSEKLGEIAAQGDQRAVLKQFIVVGKSCSGCHTDFRINKDE